MNLLYTCGLGLVIGAVSFGAGRYSSPTPPEPAVITKTQIKTETQIVEHVVKQIVRQVVHEPSGKVTETVTEKVVATENKAQEKEQTKAIEKPVVVPVPRPDWSVGVNWQPRLDPSAYVPTGAEVGRRVLGNVWATGGLDWRSHAITLGARVEW